MSVRAIVVTIVMAMSVVSFASPAPAVERPPAPGTYGAIQAGVDYTVYEPARAFGIALGELTTVPCNGLDDMTSATYGTELQPGPWINLQESQRGGCVDGTDGIAKFTTFSVRGATATVSGECTASSDCTQSTPAGVRKYALTTVTLPRHGAFGTTSVAVYTIGLSLKQIKAFVRALMPVG